jgi:hypothetical protein
VSVLKPALAGKVTLEVMSIKDDTAKGLGEKHFPNSKHGLIAYGPDGEVIDKIEGHNFGAAEINALAAKHMK